ncbi:ketose-bisphosphate aldolase [Candidatus Shapirobacteria bacterium CG09_land_8_20_14_0_10_49_15]|uniref:Ketose-bisphosphate aldolase n=1 Tax=Candidatus Shapirobacteria bacterium CG09_land_8_20_14_0_10_49_15 TaxID=1974482 RepID=A0A2M6XBS7_9BACT|nr:MAG: ketose-bisphosphate aldolase [Candidatus Shapirobacteria bacterium CG09_land_8_20_14_0_10_49_15]
MKAKEILQKARDNGYALGAFNAGSVEIVRAIVQAAGDKQAPLIIETSANEANYFGMENFLDVVENFQQSSGLEILTNFDHGPGLEECQRAIEAGYDLIHFDGSQLPLEENIKITQALVAQAHERGVLVEAEIDRIAGQSVANFQDAESVQATSNYTDPAQAAAFARQTGCDILAAFVGNLHGTYPTSPRLDLERLALIGQQVPCWLSLHGGSGLSPEDVRQAIKMGVVKVNVNTELRLAFRETLENILRGSEDVAIYKIMPPVIAAMQKIVEEKIELFGC